MSENTKDVDRSREDWKKDLPPERYTVLFEEGTEPPRSSPLNHEKRAGTYRCACCGTRPGKPAYFQVTSMAKKWSNTSRLG